MKNYVWQMWDLPIAQVRVWYGREESSLPPDIAYLQCLEYEEEY